MQTNPSTTTFSAFNGHTQIAAGQLHEVAKTIRTLQERGERSLILIFDDLSGQQIDIDLQGSVADVGRRYGPEAGAESSGSASRKGRGRPKLGVVGREITLLPRHWAWLQTQRGGASATLRRLVDEARNLDGDRDRMRQAQDAINRFISATAGNLAGFEEANRALYRGDRQRFDVECAQWPKDLRSYIEHWARLAFGHRTSEIS